MTKTNSWGVCYRTFDQQNVQEARTEFRQTPPQSTYNPVERRTIFDLSVVTSENRGNTARNWQTGRRAFRSSFATGLMQPAGVGTLYIEPGSRWENGYIESLNSRVMGLDNLRHAQHLGEQWRASHNTVRPHGSLDYATPADFASRCAPSATVAALPSLQQHTDENKKSTLSTTQPRLS